MATFTYNEVTNPESLENAIVNISPHDTPFTSMIGKTKVKSTYHEFPEDELLPANPNNAQPEGYTYAPKPVQGRIRTGNYTQIFSKGFTVTDTQEAVDKTGVSNEAAYQMRKAMIQIAKDLEVALLNNTLNVASQQKDFQTTLNTLGGKRKFGQAGTAGTVDMHLTDAYQGGGVKPNTGVARKMSGVQDLIWTHQYSGGPTIDTITQAQQETWQDGGNPRKLLVSPLHKRILSQWVEQGNSRNITINKDMADKKLVQRIDVLETDFGTIEIVPSRYLIAQTATDPITGEVLDFDLSGVTFVLDPQHWKLGTLRPFHKTKLPKQADATAWEITGEYTLENRGEKAQAIIRGKRTLTTSGGSNTTSGGSDTVSGGTGDGSIAGGN